ncbi:DUF366 family protein [Desulfuribacillus alkaliarsenatis]|uniref:DUF366 domain-containing protein n=1 Tax=Desulfuribacillus alkaliarsenatis TaxID=766136 RepID=A0A1E5G5Q2_9FIRM|nr:DUF366 family protein [Desulfuribacillus alkaliarsenatis]OEF98516.1 hypothetical protein BHF68_02305 [Desulfuribacillus alkaliarsenatis]
MKKYWHHTRIDYDGTQLSSLFAYKSFNVQGDSIVAFRGKCDVTIDEMVDIADVKDKAFIQSKDMLHFIVEQFVIDLEKAVFHQRLLTTIVKEALELEFSERSEVQRVIRSGDDLFIMNRKLSVSIATLSPVSSLIHFGINVSSEGTPVPTCGLRDLQIEPEQFAKRVLDEYTSEIEGIYLARCKVRGVK